ncbi:MAG: DUF3857 domain-containing protein [Calditrichaeota bacterium]|nr:MAG: DUF3857 domain-containing protein [Calditrichota bacterium]
MNLWGNLFVRWVFVAAVMLSVTELWAGGGDIPKFGKVSREELEMTSLPEAPDANAVFLFDVGEQEIILEDNRFKDRLKRHVRIKILTEQGKDDESITHVRIPYWKDDDVRNLRAHTILPNGKKIKVNKKDIFEEESGNWRAKVFTFPGVEVGAILECEYVLVSPNVYFLWPWYFQNVEFTKISQYSVTTFPGFAYTVFYRNTAELEPETEIIRRPGINQKLTRYTWRLEDLPPIRKEPYMRTLNDYRKALRFQLISYKDPYQYVEFIQSWEDLVKEQRDAYKEHLEVDGELKQLAAEIAPDTLDKKERVKRLYEYVRDEIETTERGGKYPGKKARKVLAERKGTGAEKNFLLINLLNAAGIPADPVIISTWDNGRIWENSPYLHQFNYVLVYARAGLRPVLLDTRDKYCPFGLLPESDLGDKGLLITEASKKAGFVNIPIPRQLNMLHCRTEASLSPTGDLTASTVMRFENYRAMRARRMIAKSGVEDVVKNILKEILGEVQIDTAYAEGMEKVDEPLRVVVQFRVPEYAQVVNEMIYASLPLINRYTENPFKRETRYFPVEFPYAEATADDIMLTLPEGYQVMELPKPARIQQQGISLMCTCSPQEGGVSIKRMFRRTKSVFSPREYSALRKFFDLAVNADQAQIVLGRQAAAAGK